MENNKLEMGGIFKHGYGLIAKSVMQNTELSLPAKGVYAYLCSYSGRGIDAFPSRKKMCHDLNISNDSLGKYLKELKEKKYISVSQSINEKNHKFANNIYTLNINLPYPNFPCTEKPYTEFSDTENLDTNNNNNNNNNINNNNNNDVAEIKKIFEENIGLLSPASAEILFDYLKDFSKDLIIKAIKIASINNKRSTKYIQGILNAWGKKGFKTILDIENEQSNYYNKKNEKQKTVFEQRQYDDLSFLIKNK